MDHVLEKCINFLKRENLRYNETLKITDTMDLRKRYRSIFMSADFVIDINDNGMNKPENIFAGKALASEIAQRMNSVGSVQLTLMIPEKEELYRVKSMGFENRGCSWAYVWFTK